MNIEIDIDELRQRKIAICTPMYGGMAGGHYTRSAIDLSARAASLGVSIDFFFLFSESLVQRARNYLADEFLRSKYTHLMFIDADIGFKSDDVLALAALAAPNTEYDIVCGPYPKKMINWGKVKLAVDKGLGDKDPTNLQRYVGDFVLNPIAGRETFAIDQPTEVAEAGTGFMMIQRSALERWATAYPEQEYLPDHAGSANFDGKRSITAFFDCVIDPTSKRYLSEDYYFCQKAREAGIKVWMCPWIELNHTGSYTFGGTLADLAALGGSKK